MENIKGNKLNFSFIKLLCYSNLLFLFTPYNRCCNRYQYQKKDNEKRHSSWNIKFRAIGIRIVVDNHLAAYKNKDGTERILQVNEIVHYSS